MTTDRFADDDYVRGSLPDGRDFEGVVHALRRYHHVDPTPGPEWTLLEAHVPPERHRTIAWHPEPPTDPKPAIDAWQEASENYRAEDWGDDLYQDEHELVEPGDNLAGELRKVTEERDRMRDLVERARPIVEELGHEWGYDYADAWLDETRKLLGGNA